MTGSARAGLFDDDPDFEVTGFEPRRPDDRRLASAPDDVRQVAEAHKFVSREAARPQVPQGRPPRRYRTGRNIQLNIKARQETVDAFYRIADEQGWMIAETLERAIAALERELDAQET